MPTCRIVEKLGEDLRSNLQSKTNTTLWYATGEKISFSTECLKRQGKKQKPSVTSGWAIGPNQLKQNQTCVSRLPSTLNTNKALGFNCHIGIEP